MIMTISRDEYAKAFSKRLRLAVDDSGLSGKEIAAMANIGRPAVSQYLNGRAIPSAFVLAKLCVVLGVDANVLLGTTGVMKRV